MRLPGVRLPEVAEQRRQRAAQDAPITVAPPSLERVRERATDGIAAYYTRSWDSGTVSVSLRGASVRVRAANHAKQAAPVRVGPARRGATRISIPGASTLFTKGLQRLISRGSKTGSKLTRGASRDRGPRHRIT